MSEDSRAGACRPTRGGPCNICISSRGAGRAEVGISPFSFGIGQRRPADLGVCDVVWKVCREFMRECSTVPNGKSFLGKKSFCLTERPFFDKIRNLQIEERHSASVAQR